MMTIPGPPIEARWRLLTPPGVPAALAIIAVEGDVDRALERLGQETLPVGALAVRDIAGQDRAVLARFAPDRLLLMPHGGVAVVRAITHALARAGIAQVDPAPDPPPRLLPRTLAEIEAILPETLAAAASPLAVDLLLDQPRRWRHALAVQGSRAIIQPSAPHERRRESILRRLIRPPLVVALGPANIGKSTLLNALTGRTAAVVADEPGTTRDHVGVRLNLAELVVQYADTPGLRNSGDKLERATIASALALLPRADLVLRLGDAGAPPPDAAWVGEMAPGASSPAVALRSDLGAPAWQADVRVCVPRGEGLAALVALLREALAPAEVLADEAPWRFWA